jgi:hypothetical protein
MKASRLRLAAAYQPVRVAVCGCRSLKVFTIVASLVLAGAAACSSGPKQSSVTAHVSPSTALHLTIRGVATVSGPAGSFRGTGTVTASPVHVALPFGGGLSAAGTGIDVTFAGAKLVRPLTIVFDATGKPGPDAIPVVAHRQVDGQWDLTRASIATAGQMQVSAEAFSPHIPAWLHPTKWLTWFGNRMASLIGGRTAPINCAGGGPSWAAVVKLSDAVHTCLVPNTDQASHAVRAEVQLKSNRGTALEVDMPPGAAYTWVAGQPWAIRRGVWAHLIHQDPNLMALLPAGATMTAGYLRPGGDEDLDFQVRVTYWSLAYTLFGDILDVLAGSGAGKADDATNSNAITDLYMISKCSSAVDYTSLSAHNPLKAATFSSALRCVVSSALSGLSSPAKATGAAESLLGPGIDKADEATAVSALTSVGGKLLTFGWILQLWPFLQAGWGQLPDVIENILTDGANALVDLRVHGAGGPAPPASSVAALTPAGSQSASSPIVNWHGIYWFAVATESSNGAIEVVTATLYRWNGSVWQRQATIPIANSDGTLASGGLDPSTPISVQSLTGAATPDFLIHSYGADTDWLNVISEATGRWAAVLFDDSGGPTFGENEIGISGTTVTIGYDNCLPNCATGGVTKVAFKYSNGAFVPVDAPGCCTGEALAQAAHRSAPHGSNDAESISGFACTGGYAAAIATNGNYGWTMTFKSTGNDWAYLASGNIMPPNRMPQGTYRALRNAIEKVPQNTYYPY